MLASNNNEFVINVLHRKHNPWVMSNFFYFSLKVKDTKL